MARDQGAYPMSRRSFCRTFVGVLVAPGIAIAQASNGFWWDHRFEVLDAATKHGLPTMADDSAMVREAGTLIAHDHLQVEEDRVRAEYIDRILRGGKHADLPVR